MGPLGASCFYTLSDGHRTLSAKEWDELRFGQVCTDSANFADWKAATLKLCKKTGMCSYKDKQDIQNFNLRLEAFAAQALTVRTTQQNGR